MIHTLIKYHLHYVPDLHTKTIQSPPDYHQLYSIDHQYEYFDTFHLLHQTSSHCFPECHFSLSIYGHLARRYLEADDGSLYLEEVGLLCTTPCRDFGRNSVQSGIHKIVPILTNISLTLSKKIAEVRRPRDVRMMKKS